MRNRSKLLLTGLIASLTMAAAASSTSANNLSISRTSGEVAWANLTLDTAGVDLECEVTLLGSFHANTMAKVERALIGAITHAVVAEGGDPGVEEETCTGGSTTVLDETLPWHVRYRNFAGRLPIIQNITIDLIGAAFRFNMPGANCLTGTTLREPGVGIAERDINSGAIATLTVDSSKAIDLNGGFVCDFIGDGTFGGTAAVADYADLVDRDEGPEADVPDEDTSGDPFFVTLI